MCKLHAKVVLIIVSFIAIIACNPKPAETDVVSTDTIAAVTMPPSDRPTHWSYTEEGGPSGWASLDPVYASCGEGKSQSPVDIETSSSSGAPQWSMEYKTTNLQISHNEHVEELINNGHTIQITPQEGSTITYNGNVYHLKQFHFHTPSEHTIDGKHAPMEIHFVHKSDDGNLAVIGVLVKEGKHNANFDQIIKNLPDSVGQNTAHDNINIDLSAHLPEKLSAYHYTGSLTTPPCSENVQWMVMQNHVMLSTEQINEFAKRLRSNNRPTQPLNGRTMTIDQVKSSN